MIDWLGKLLFHREPLHERRRKLGALAAAVVVGLLLAAGVGLALYWMNVRAHH